MAVNCKPIEYKDNEAEVQALCPECEHLEEKEIIPIKKGCNGVNIVWIKKKCSQCGCKYEMRA